MNMVSTSYFQTRHCPTSNFKAVCYTEVYQHRYPQAEARPLAGQG